MILFSQTESDFACLDINSEIILINRIFFRSQTEFLTKSIFIRKMIFFILIRELSINKHMSDEYAIIEMHFSENKKKKKSVMIKII